MKKIYSYRPPTVIKRSTVLYYLNNQTLAHLCDLINDAAPNCEKIISTYVSIIESVKKDLSNCQKIFRRTILKCDSLYLYLKFLRILFHGAMIYLISSSVNFNQKFWYLFTWTAEFFISPHIILICNKFRFFQYKKKTV